MMEFARIVFFSTLAAIAYGILHDMVTAHVCVEYFTIAHPPVFPTEVPFLLAIGWGVIATWWVGLPLGLAAATAARIGGHNQLAWRDLQPMLVWLLGGMALCALVAGIASALLAAQGQLLYPGWREDIPEGKWISFNFDAGAHLASYASGILGGWVLICFIVVRRFRKSPDRAQGSS